MAAQRRNGKRKRPERKGCEHGDNESAEMYRNEVRNTGDGGVADLPYPA